MDPAEVREMTKALAERISASQERTRQLLDAAARARRQSRRVRAETKAVRELSFERRWALWSRSPRVAAPDVIPLSWGTPMTAEEVLDEARAAARECASACSDGVRVTPRGVRGSLAAIAAVASLAADLLEGGEGGRDVLALGLCVRIIESTADALDEAGRSPTGLVAASAARRCAERCSQALLTLYAFREDES